ncbi:aromatic ring-hydroxylating dioxygenase subunit alpha [Pseudoduganella sp. LjRoot289]|uniref:aromatic ring-hydroxylating dioxygenase subunit alpha n=1 Tax=Pseudoduganella sp. LjRoot289 TaxID=3342314 RepID=UPI003ECD5ED9
MTPHAPHDTVLYNDWHPVASAGTIGAGAIVRAQLLDLPLALWRDSGGQAHAWEDRCPHRGTRLSLGTQQGDTLRCAYHGWRFGLSGRCKHIPALPELAEANLKAQVATFAVQERYGLLWACLGTPSGAVPPFPEFSDARLRKVLCGPYDVQAAGPRIVENFLDMAHFAFVHEGILGEQERAAIASYTVEQFDDDLYGKGVRAIQCRAWQPQASKEAAAGSDVEYTYRVVRPLSAILTKLPADANGLPSDAIGLHVQPLTETTSRVWITLALNDFTSSDDELRHFQDTIFLQDLPIVESQQPQRMPLTPGAEVSVACDRMSLAYRSYLKAQDLRYGVIR